VRERDTGRKKEEREREVLEGRRTHHSTRCFQVDDVGDAVPRIRVEAQCVVGGESKGPVLLEEAIANGTGSRSCCKYTHTTTNQQALRPKQRDTDTHHTHTHSHIHTRRHTDPLI